MGKPAARLGDMTTHGGTVTVGCPTVLIGGMPAARLGDMHVCPMLNPGTPPPPHVGGPISMASTGVLIGGMPAARMGDMATCAGPPDTIAAGCPNVLIGEAGGGGGGGGGGAAGGGGGGSGAAAAASEMSVAVATSEGEPEEASGESHWVELQFVDKAGNAVGAVPYDFKGTDGKSETGVLPNDGRIRRDRVPAGAATARLFSLSNARWSVSEARTDETVGLSAQAEGFKPGTPARITIYKRDLRGSDKEVAVIESEISGTKVQAEWEYQNDDPGGGIDADSGQGYSRCEHFFVVEAGGCRAVSDTLVYKDWIEIEITDAEDRPLKNEPYRLTLSNGETREGKLDGNGSVRIKEVPPGRYKFVLVNYPEVVVDD